MAAASMAVEVSTAQDLEEVTSVAAALAFMQPRMHRGSRILSAELSADQSARRNFPTRALERSL